MSIHSFTQNLCVIAESYLSLIDHLPLFSLPMSYSWNCANFTKISELKTRSHRLSRVFLFENWKFLACCYLIIWYLNQFQRCNNRSFLSCIIFQTSLFSLYLRKIVNNFITHTQNSKTYTCRIVSHFSSNFTIFWRPMLRSNLS